MPLGNSKYILDNLDLLDAKGLEQRQELGLAVLVGKVAEVHRVGGREQLGVGPARVGEAVQRRARVVPQQLRALGAHVARHKNLRKLGHLHPQRLAPVRHTCKERKKKERAKKKGGGERERERERERRGGNEN